MASPSGLFYAYAKTDTDDWSARYLICFASRSVADEWWRAITLSVRRGYTRFSHVVRHSIQFYSFNASLANICDTLTDGNITSGTNLLSKVFFTLIVDQRGREICPAPSLNYIEHRSGDAFYIRSMLQPEIFWFYDPSAGFIRPSYGRKTKFILTVIDREQRLGPNPIMVGNDRITISIRQCTLYALEKGIGELKPSDGGLPIARTDDPSAQFNFSDFDGGFEIMFPPDNDWERGGLHEAVIFPGQLGERWELV